MSATRLPRVLLRSVGFVVVLLFAALFACTESARRPLAPPDASDETQIVLKPGDASLALQRIDALKVQIDAFTAAGEISAKTAKELKARLDGAARDINKGNALFAIGRMAEFVLFVKLQCSKQTISKAAADILEQRAIEIIEILKGHAPNQPPSVQIVKPADQSTFAAGAPVDFKSSVNDPEDGALVGESLVWTSNIDGQIGTGTWFDKSDLSAGTHTITLTATDSDGASASASVQITVQAGGGGENHAPVAQIGAPANDAQFQFGAAINFAGSGSDTEDGALSAASLVWTSSIGGQIGTGESFSKSDLAVGSHTITLTVTDANGATGTASVQITVQPPPNQSPSAGITAPGNLTSFQQGTPISFAGTGSDPEDGALSGASLVWTSSISGPIGTGASFTRSDLALGTHTITLTATDSKGATGSASVQITVEAAPNQAPSAQISSPANQAFFQRGAPISFAGSGLDAEDGALTGSALVWTSSIDGQIGTGASFTRGDLSAGTHTIILKATDGQGASDTAGITIRINAPPSVSIASPANGATFVRLADNIAFQGSATDAEDGALTGTWTSSIDGPIGTGASFTRNNLTFGTHIITLTATDHDGATSSASITIAVDGGHISVPATLNVPFTQTAQLPIQLVAPAPPGGALLTVVSSDPAHVTVATPAVTIPAGQVAANATLNGTLPGPATVTVSGDHYAIGVTQVTTTATVNILQTSASLTSATPATITLQLESGSTPVAAPAGGVTVTVAADNPGCVAATSPLTISAGQVQATATLSYGGTATIPCTATVTAGAPNYTADNISATVSNLPAITIAFDPRVGTGLQQQLPIGLPAGHIAANITITSSDPGVLLVSPNATTPGAATATLNVPANTNANFYVQGVEGQTGTATVTLSAPGFTSGSRTGAVVQPALELSNLTTSTTTQTGNDEFTVVIGAPQPGNTFVGTGQQAIRAGGTAVTVTLTSSNTAAGQLVTTAGGTGATVTVQIQPGQLESPPSAAQGGVAFDPLGAGSTTIAATIPGFIQTTAGSRDVNVVAPTIIVGASVVGSGLQTLVPFSGLPAGHAGGTFTATSSDPSILLVSPNATTAGAASATVVVAAGNTNPNFLIQGVEGRTGTATVTLSAAGYTNGGATMTVAQPALDINGLNTSPTTRSGDDDFSVRVGLPLGANTQVFGGGQAVRVGGPALTLTLTSSDAAVGELRTGTSSGASVTIQIQPGQPESPLFVVQGGVAFRPLSGGTTIVAATIPGFIQTTAGARQVNVTAATIVVGNVDPVVGTGLQEPVAVALPAGHGGTTVTLTSSDPSVLLVSPNATTPGAPSATITFASQTQNGSFFIQGVEGKTGTATVTASAPGFTNGARLASVVQPAFDIVGLGASTTTQSANDLFSVRVGIPFAGNTAVTGSGQAVRAGGTALTATVTSSNPFVGQLVTLANTGGTVTVQIVPGEAQSAGTAQGGVEFDPVGFGSTTVSASMSGLIQTTAATQSVNVVAPPITVVPATVGAGLQQGTSLFLVSGHPGATVTITSSDPSLLLVSPNGSTAGAASIDIVVAPNNPNVTFFVQGIEGRTGTATVTATAAGYTNGTALMTVVQPALDIDQLSATQGVSSADDPFVVRVGLPTANSSQVAAGQAVRVGGSALTVTITSGSIAVGRLVTTAGTGSSITVQIQPGQDSSPSAVSVGGVAFDPLGIGTTQVGATITGFIQTANGLRLVTVN